METLRREIRSFVIRAARLSPAQRKAIEELTPLYGVPFPPAPNLNALFPTCSKVVVEIGFGNGEATSEIAKAHPEVGFLGLEVHPPGVGQLLREIHTSGLANLRVLRHDAVEVVRSLSTASADGFHVFFPDPWPKKKHHKRRLLQPPFLKEMVRVLKPGGYWYFATDWEEYALEVKADCEQIGELINPYSGWAENIAWRPSTKFEAKGIRENRPIRELYFLKRSES